MTGMDVGIMVIPPDTGICVGSVGVSGLVSALDLVGVLGLASRRRLGPSFAFGWA